MKWKRKGEPVGARGMLLVLAACPWVAMCATPSSPGKDAKGYWSTTCVSGDGRSLLAGGDHATLLDLATGHVLEARPGMVKAVGCEPGGGVVVGYGGAVRLPGQADLTPVPSVGETVLGLSPEGAWISSSRSINRGQWRGPAAVFVTEKGEPRRTELLPARFGPVGAARSLSILDSFAVRFGTLLRDGRLLLAAGWQPSRSGGSVEAIPWGLFAWDLARGEATPLTEPLASDTVFNQGWFQRVAATPDAARMAVAVHDGERVTVAQFEKGSRKPSRINSVASQGSPSALALSTDGAFVAVGTEMRGREAPAKAWVIDPAGKELWSDDFPKTVIGLHFLPDGSLVVAAADAMAVRVSLPAGTEMWRAR